MERAGNAAILPADPLISPITGHHFPGGVAERLIAPVLKTGRPKGLVSSNLTPSASNFRFSIFDFRVVAKNDALPAARKESPGSQRTQRRTNNAHRGTSAKMR